MCLAIECRAAVLKIVLWSQGIERVLGHANVCWSARMHGRKTVMQGILLMLVQKLKLKWFRIDLIWAVQQAWDYLRVANTEL